MTKEVQYLGAHQVILQTDRTIEVAHNLIDCWQARQNPMMGKGFYGLDHIEYRLLPDEVIRGSRFHALLLWFWAWLNRYGDTANRLMSHGASLALAKPQIIDPLIPVTEEDLYLMAPFITFGTSSANTLFAKSKAAAEDIRHRIQGWINNRQLLAEKYQSDPRNILLSIGPDRQRLIKAFCQFHGIQQKIAQLAMIWYQEIDYWDTGTPEQWQTICKVPAIPVDHWVMRLVRQLDLIESWTTERRDTLSPIISNLLCRVCDQHELNHIIFSQALWNLGANVCFNKPKIRRERFVYCGRNCPAEQYCRYDIESVKHYYGVAGTTGWSQAISRSLFRAPPLPFLS